MGATHFSGPVVSANGFQATAGFIIESSVTSITAGTTRTQGGATAITTEISRVDTSTAPSAGATLGDGIILPVSQAGMELWIWNNTNYNVQLYGNGSDTVNGIAGATGLIMPPNSVYAVIAAAAGAWEIDGVGAGASGNFPTVTAVDGLSANSGGVQAGATPLLAQINRVTTVGGAGYSVLLPACKAGMQVTVINATASTSMNVFPAGTDAINALSASAAFAVAGAKTVQFYAAKDGLWHTILTA